MARRARISEAAYRALFQPLAATEDSRRQEFILDTLLAGAVVLSLLATIATLYERLTLGEAFQGAAPGVMALVFGLFTALYIASRCGWYKPVAHIFVTMFFLVTTVPLIQKGVMVSQAVLTYGLIVVIAGVLIGTVEAFATAAAAGIVLLGIIYLDQQGILHAEPELAVQRGHYVDGVVYALTLGLIALVSWLANRDIARSLQRARHSEAALLEERNSLEVKVRERTKDLEQAQLEKMLQMQQFAAFGRLSATLIHDLASPLTAVSLSLEQLNERKKSDLLEAARAGTAAMERYVASARRQLQQRPEARDFNPADEIRQVLPLLESRARVNGVRLQLNLAPSLRLHGNSIQFSHVVCNIIMNAIDAYDGVDNRRRKVVYVTLKPAGAMAMVVVLDHGSGIPPHELPHIFDAFYTTKYTPESLGLGLAIVKQIVEDEFHGTITASSSPRAGTRFTVMMARA